MVYNNLFYVEVPQRKLENSIAGLNDSGFTVQSSKLQGENIILAYYKNVDLFEMKRRSLTLDFKSDEVIKTMQVKRNSWERLLAIFVR